ncbi:hypothetical protein [Qipengyuania gelatinilytica]|uniref:Uncharacterized protein n=1 Tax=Qipengyuania gelatinilytica TaxID=2867231 RepID=A0ABX9A2X6_9SPHN|nr:hypothetical protein [Qipengyuania gelatinilytica]QZD95412.1 hypothetical protein K3136_01395 [Qipengyuania gelatinilytica]
MKKFAVFLGALALGSSAMAIAQETAPSPKPDQEVIVGGVRYFMPIFVETISKKCAGSLAPDGYLATNMNALTAKFAEGAEANWPHARALVAAIVNDGKNGPRGSNEFDDLPDEVIKPMIEIMLPEKLAEDIEEKHCAPIEEVMESLDPLPADNFATFVGTVIKLAWDDKGRKRENTEG